TVPPNGLLIRFQRTVRPTLPYASVAPITATVWGEKIASSGFLAACSTSPDRFNPAFGSLTGRSPGPSYECTALDFVAARRVRCADHAFHRGKVRTADPTGSLYKQR